jgi:hypothetical protein
MAVHHDCGNAESLHQKARTNAVMAGVRFFKLQELILASRKVR